MPFFVGLLDVDSATVSGKTVRFATYPRGAFDPTARAKAWDQIKRSMEPQVAVFGEVPWDTYTVMEIVDSTTNALSGLEHANSHVNIMAPGAIGGKLPAVAVRARDLPCVEREAVAPGGPRPRTGTTGRSRPSGCG